MPVNSQHQTHRKGKGSKKKVYGPSKSQLKKLDLDQEIAEIDEKIKTIVRVSVVDVCMAMIRWIHLQMHCISERNLG
jgi:hypothetical protein